MTATVVIGYLMVWQMDLYQISPALVLFFYCALILASAVFVYCAMRRCLLHTSEPKIRDVRATENVAATNDSEPEHCDEQDEELLHTPMKSKINIYSNQNQHMNRRQSIRQGIQLVQQAHVELQAEHEMPRKGKSVSRTDSKDQKESQSNTDSEDYIHADNSDCCLDNISLRSSNSAQSTCVVKLEDSSRSGSSTTSTVSRSLSISNAEFCSSTFISFDQTSTNSEHQSFPSKEGCNQSGESIEKRSGSSVSFSSASMSSSSSATSTYSSVS
jgi:hypothetical protein